MQNFKVSVETSTSTALLRGLARLRGRSCIRLWFLSLLADYIGFLFFSERWKRLLKCHFSSLLSSHIVFFDTIIATASFSHGSCHLISLNAHSTRWYSFLLQLLLMLHLIVALTLLLNLLMKSFCKLDRASIIRYKAFRLMRGSPTTSMMAALLPARVRVIQGRALTRPLQLLLFWSLPCISSHLDFIAWDNW